ncbi:MAG: preprotein translocase subunit SecE [Patescibacteria group bacterium]
MNIFRVIVSYFATAYQELTKVVWPTRREVIRHTLVIALGVILTVIFLGLLDYSLTALLKLAIVTQ